jgi:hypothetical protein
MTCDYCFSWPKSPGNLKASSGFHDTLSTVHSFVCSTLKHNLSSEGYFCPNLELKSSSLSLLFLCSSSVSSSKFIFDIYEVVLGIRLLPGIPHLFFPVSFFVFATRVELGLK